MSKAVKGNPELDQEFHGQLESARVAWRQLMKGRYTDKPGDYRNLDNLDLKAHEAMQEFALEILKDLPAVTRKTTRHIRIRLDQGPVKSVPNRRRNREGACAGT